MLSSVSEYIGDSILDDLKDEVPKRNDFRYRKERFGYTFFDIETLSTALIDKTGFMILSEIDGKKDIKSILKKVSKKTQIPYFILAATATKYIYYLSKNKNIRINRETPYKFSYKFSDFPILNGPNHVSWLITNECNLRCTHCGNTAKIKKENELTLDECYKFIDECGDLKVFILNISGGEPFLRKNWFEILKYARKKGIEIGITTNGTLIDEKIAEGIKEIKAYNIHLSLDGIGKVHDEFRNKIGVFDSVLNAIKLFREHKIPFGITTSVTKRNFSDLDNIKDFIKENRINSWEIYYAIPVGCLDKVDSISREEFLELSKKISAYKTEMKGITVISVGDSLGYYGSIKVRDTQWHGCGAGLNGCAIDAEGNVKGCPIHPEPFIEGNIRERSLKDIWLDKNKFAYNRKKIRLSKHCKKCEHSKVCKGGCKTSMYSQGTELKYNNYCIKLIESKNNLVFQR